MSEINNSSSNFIHGLIDEDIAEGNCAADKIMTRFPPEPNGYLHIGHAKAICLNFTVAQKYGGTCNLRFDDTNPAKEEEEYVQSIKEDVRWLGFDWANLYFGSDFFDRMYECATDLIKKGRAYVDDLSADEIRTMRGTLTETGKESPYRNRSVDENLTLFLAMKSGKYKDGEKVLRAKIDMNSPNMNMRDPVIYRISHTAHHRTGNKWCVYPMYDFAHPLEDAIEGITHSLCTMEFEDHRPLYNWSLRELEWKNPPRQIEFARLNLTHTPMSKRYLKELVDNNKVSGWEDPRMPTIAGLRRRGYTPEAIRDFCERVGVAKANSEVDIALLEHCIRDDLKTKVCSKNVIFDPIKVTITNYPEGEAEEVLMENNRENLALGEREVPFSGELYVDGNDFMEVPIKKYFRLFPGNEVRFKGAYFIKCTEAIKDDKGRVIELLCTYDPLTKSGSGFEERKVKGTIHWVEAKSAVPITVREYGYLMEECVEDTESKNTIFNENSVIEKHCFAEPSIMEAREAVHLEQIAEDNAVFMDKPRYQFFRHGYYVLDKDSTERELVFNQIVGLKSSFK